MISIELKKCLKADCLFLWRTLLILPTFLEIKNC